MPEFAKVVAAVILLGGCASSVSDRYASTETAASSAQSPSEAASAPETAQAVLPASDRGTDSRVSGQTENDADPSATNALQQVAAHISQSGTPGAATYRIGPQDVIEVSVFMVPELSRTVQISDAGAANLPLIGEVPVAGKTGREVEQDITRLLKAKYLQKPQVSVFVKEYNSQRITVEGAVRRPGVFPIQGGMSLLQAVATAQGMEEISDNTVLVFRNSDGQRKAARFDISEIRSGEAPDPELVAGDVVVAGTSTIKKGFNGFIKVLPIAGLFTLL
jgi:polysaccharide export outer membrane protein